MGQIGIRVLYFAMAGDMTGVHEERFFLDTPTSASDLLREAERKHPGLSRLRPYVRVAVEEELVSDEAELRDGETVAILPPFSGG